MPRKKMTNQQIAKELTKLFGASLPDKGAALAPPNCSAAVLVRELLHWTRTERARYLDHLKHSDPDIGSNDYHQGAADVLETIEGKAVRLCEEMGLSSERQPQQNAKLTCGGPRP